MNTTSLAIFGAGNTGMSLYNGKVSHDPIYGVHNISLMRRNYLEDYYFNQHFDNDFEKKNLKNFEKIFLAMKPYDAVDAIYGMKDKVNPDSIIISCVTGLNIDTMGRVYGGNHRRFVKCTHNLGIGYGTGMVVYNTPSDKTAEEVEEFFSRLSIVTERRSSKKTSVAVTIVGSGPAFFAKDLFLRYEKEEIGFTEFLNSLTIDESGVRNYIEIFKYACRMVFNDDTLAENSVRSTLETLKKCCFSPEDLLRFIERVATKKGSTETKINDFDSLEKVTTKFFIEALPVIHRKVKFFEKLIQTDLKKYNLPTNERSKARSYSFTSGCSKM